MSKALKKAINAKPKKAAKAAKAVKAAVVEAAIEKAGRQSKVNDPEIIAQVADMRDNQALKWREIATDLGMSEGRVQMAYYNSKGATGTPTPKAVLTARDKEGLSWGRIAAQFGISEGKARTLYVEGGGDLLATTLNRGGRKPAGVIVDKPAKASSKVVGAKPARKGKKGKFVITPEMDDDAIVNAVDGRKVVWNKIKGDGTSEATLKPGSAKIGTSKSGQRVLSFNDGNKGRSIPVDNIVKVG